MSKGSAPLSLGKREFTLFSREDPENYHRRPGNAWRGGDHPFSPDSAFLKSGLCVQLCELPSRGLVLAKAGSLFGWG